jgi:hypothetical protein
MVDNGHEALATNLYFDRNFNTDAAKVLPGHAYVAPGHSHLLRKRSGANYVTELSHARVA